MGSNPRLLSCSACRRGGNVLVRDRPSVSRSTKCIAHAHPVVDFRAGFQDATRSDKHPGGGNRVAGRNIQLAKLLANRTRPAGKPIQEPLAKGVGSHIPKRRYEVEIDYVVGVKGHKPLDVFGAHGSRSTRQQFPNRGFHGWHRLFQSLHFARLPGIRLFLPRCHQGNHRWCFPTTSVHHLKQSRKSSWRAATR